MFAKALYVRFILLVKGLHMTCEYSWGCKNLLFYHTNPCYNNSEPFPKQALAFRYLQYKTFENTVGKGEIAQNKQFLLFTQCVLPFWRIFWHFHQSKLLSENFRFESQQFVIWERLRRTHLTNYQTTNFKLFQNERVCRRQFQICRKWKKVIQTGRKHWEKEKSLNTSNFSLSHSVFNRLVSQRCQKVSLCGNGLKTLLEKDKMHLLAFTHNVS